MAMRSIELYNKTWDCPDCGNVSTNAVKKCRKCGREKPVYGVTDKKTGKGPEKANESNKGEIFAVSTLGEENRKRHGLK